MQHPADLDLARRASRADATAFERLFADTLEPVHAFVARRVESREATERVTERVLTRAFATLVRYDGSTPLSAWVLSILKQELRAEASASRPAIPPSGASAALPGSGA